MCQLEHTKVVRLEQGIMGNESSRFTDRMKPNAGNIIVSKLYFTRQVVILTSGKPPNSRELGRAGKAFRPLDYY